MADTNNNLYAYSQRRCAADKNTRGNPVNQVYPQACAAEEAPKYRDIVFECGMRDYMWREKVKAALTPEDKDKRKCRVFNESPRDLWDNAPTVERKLNRSGCESPLGDPCPDPCALIPWSPEEPTIENILRAETKEPIDPPPVVTQPQPVPKPSPKNKPPVHWLLCEPRPEKPARHDASQYYDDKFEAIPLHHLNSRHLDTLTDETLESDSREPPKHRSRVPHCECVTEDYANICEVHPESQIWKCLSDLQPPAYRSTSARVLPPMTDRTRPRTRIRDNLIDCDVNNNNM